jgi:mono/diheme cytochrome c family protein
MNPDPKPPVNAPEPGRPQLPAWLIVVFCALLFGELIYLDRNAGGFNAQVYAPYHSIQEVNAAQPVRPADPLMEKGGHLFTLACAPCHQANGMGTAGQFPALAGSEWVMEKDPARLVRILQLGAAGAIMVKGQECNPPGAMPSMAAIVATDEDMAAVLTYIRQSWGNTAPGVTPGQVKQIRATLGDRKDPTSAAELMKVPVAQ